MKFRPTLAACAVACTTVLAVTPALAAPTSAKTTVSASPAANTQTAGDTNSALASATSIMNGTTGTYRERAHKAIDASDVSPADKARLRAIVNKLPADLDTKLDAAAARLGVPETQWSAIRDSAIDPTDYRCDETKLGDWLTTQTAGWTPFDALVYNVLPISEIIMYLPLLFGQESKTNTFGVDGSYTSMMNSEMKDLRSFWDIPGDDIELIPMHGAAAFDNRDHLALTIQFIFGGPYTGEPEQLALDHADQIEEALDLAPGLRGGDHPIFTFNAFAFDPEGELPGVTKRIVMGDGIMEGMAGVGVDTKVGPRSILAHEYGHHVQYVNDLFESDLTGPEATRRTELMADSLSAYFLVHSRGEALNARRTLDGQRAAFEVGDCSFTSDGHHGTPAQRSRSAAWAADVVDSAPNQGHILPSKTFAEEFEEELPELIAPDA